MPTLAGAKAAGPGTIEICKDAKNGMTGKSFHFSVSGVAAGVTVAGGGCSGPVSVAAGNVTVVETATAGLQVANIKANGKVSEDLGTGTVVVKVKAGSMAATETLVTYTNQALPAVGLKVCKATPDPGLVGDQFSFTLNGGAAFSVAAGPSTAPKCSALKKYPLGTVVNVAELASTETVASAITVSDGRGSNVNVAAGTVSAAVGSGVTVVTYTNILKPHTDTGFIEVCKRGSDEYVAGDFSFTITAPGFTASRTVAVSQCTEPISVPAGNVSVAEAARFPYAVGAIDVAPAGRLVTANLANRTTTVIVPKGDSSNETLVTFTNKTLTGQVKICKAIPAGSGALAGKMFSFSVNPFQGTADADTIVAGAAGTTACVIHPEALPLGSAVSIVETGTANVQNTSVTVTPASQDAGSTPPTAKLTVGSGITTATFTNAAFGTVEVCKTAADSATATQPFQFTVNGGAPISVKAGACSLPITVPVGTATVSEVAKTNFHLVGVVAIGPGNTNRLTSALTANPATVSVPFGGVDNETVVTVTNAVNTGRFKMCKVSSETTLQNSTFQFTSSYTVNGTTTNGSAALKPGQCSSLSGDIPVVDANGNPIAVSIAELQVPTIQVSSITVANGTLVTSNLAAGTATVNVKLGNAVVTYTNVRTPLGTIQVCKIAADASTATQTFQFTVNGAAPVSVKAGQCSSVMTVLSGPATVQEVSKTNFHVVGVTATGPGNTNRLTSNPTTNPAIATVVPGNASTKTIVTFTNAVDTSQLVICKQTIEPTFQDRVFDFTYTSDPASGTAHLKPGQCSTPSSPIPVVDPNGIPYPVKVVETLGADVDIEDISVSNGVLSNVDFATGSTNVTVHAGQTGVAFLNKLKPPPTVRVCKVAGDAGTAGQPFKFEVDETINVRHLVEVNAGECTDLTLLRDTTSVGVTEGLHPGFVQVGVTATGPAGDNRITFGPNSNGGVQVSVFLGGASNVTTVTFTNKEAPKVRVCKVAGDAATVGKDFEFEILRENGDIDREFDVTAGECSDPKPIPSDDLTQVTVVEQDLLGFSLAAATATGPTGDDRLVDGPLRQGNADEQVVVSVFPGGDGNVTTVTFTNKESPRLRICKVAGDDVSKDQPFVFQIEQENGEINLSLKPGDCSTAFHLDDNTDFATVREIAQHGYSMVGVTVTGPTGDDRLRGGPDTRGDVDAGVVPGGAAETTTVTFTNKAAPEFRICKIAGDAGTAGKQFIFDISFGEDNGGRRLKVNAGECSEPVYVDNFTSSVAQTSIAVNEFALPQFKLTGVTATGPSGDNRLVNGPDSDDNYTVSVVPGGAATLTTITFTNEVQPPPTVRVCKVAGDGVPAGTVFTMFVDDGFKFLVRDVKAGECSADLELTPGVTQATVSEGTTAGYQIAGVTATGPSNDDRWVSGPDTTGHVVVSIFGGGVANETTVTFTNEVVKPSPMIRVCKAASAGVPADTSFTFSVDDGPTLVHIRTVKPGECSDPISLTIGTTHTTVTEAPSSGFEVAGVTATGPGNDNRFVSGPDANGTYTVSTASGGVANETTVTFTNEEGPRVRVCKVAGDAGTAGHAFEFLVKESGTTTHEFDVNAGECSDPIVVTGGQTTVDVQEIDQFGFTLVGATATGPTGDNRLVSGPTASFEVTVSVFPGGTGNMTTVTFTNKVFVAAQNLGAGHVLT